MMIKTFRVVTIACAALLYSNISLADDWYQVEVIVFEYTHPNQDAIELWDDHPGEPDWKQGMYLTDEATAKAKRKQVLAASTPEEGPPTAAQAAESGEAPAPSSSTDVPKQSFITAEEAITGKPDQAPAAPPTEAPLAFVALPSSEFTLGSVMNKLSKQNSYRILAHAAWRQPSLGGNELETVHLVGGTLLDKGSDNSDAHYEFEGLITLKTSRFLHLDVDAVLRERDSQNLGGKYDSPADLGLLESTNNGQDRMPVYQSYRLTQSQRVRSNKLYYFDHPLMGIIVKISPYGG